MNKERKLKYLKVKVGFTVRRPSPLNAPYLKAKCIGDNLKQSNFDLCEIDEVDMEALMFVIEVV